MPILTDEERLGSTLAGKYVIDALVGRGGMGTVFAGHHALSGRGVAVKLLHPQHVRDPIAVRRFLNEAKTAAAFRHPNVVDVLDVDVIDDGTVFLVLELLDGETLGEKLDREKKLTLEQTLSITIPVLRALAHGHKMHIVHRDLKPDNIFLTASKNGIVPVVLDFGIAKMVDAGEQSVETVTGAILGTPQYMAPEQALGSNESAATLDVYAMGVVVFECLSGRRPIDGPNPAAILARLVTGQIPSLATIAPDLPPTIVSVVDKAISAKREDRFQTCDEFAEALMGAARALGVEVEIADSSARLSTADGARTQRIRAATAADLTARRAALKVTSTPPTAVPETLTDTNRPTTGEAGVSASRKAHTTFAPTTSARSSSSSSASLIGAILAFAIVGGAGALTLRRGESASTTAARATPPVASSLVQTPTVAEPAQRQTAAPPLVPLVADAGVFAAQTSVRRVGRNTRVAGSSAEVGATTTAPVANAQQTPTVRAARPNSTTQGSGQPRPPQVAVEW